MKRDRFGELLRELRTERGVSLRVLGEAAGVSHVYISEVERGIRRRPSDERVRRIATALGVEVSWFGPRICTRCGQEVKT